MKAQVRFWKYHGSGNDFVLIDLREDDDLKAPVVRAICQRHTGVGADGILALKNDDEQRPMMRVFNADGSVADMCGNGLRCFVRWLVEEMGFAAEENMAIGSDAGVQYCSPVLDPAGAVTAIKVNLGAAKFTGEAALEIGTQSYLGTDLFLGNPHYVIARAPESNEPETMGPSLSTHDQFPRDTNVEWLNVIDRRTARVVVYERGVGLTQACGTGGAATAATAVSKGLMEPDVDLTIHQPGGTLLYRVVSDSGHVWMTGPAKQVYSGELQAQLLATH